ncbi:hypothetical protein FNH05_28930 [Amycolatopsis rhizosphaerae]|uniref:Uncharacterized protein n=1 Tax=Amycolatopsis rhizosphaerae TaxID=2053003 RepID=A0A558B2I6_9PSEU|nr:hypothetical protein [Amycolatopsis rhizosphaerae]TVT30683.1 hypothetical protein FNH05_28930 [Amycolatopsis rhizosphaerae]
MTSVTDLAEGKRKNPDDGDVSVTSDTIEIVPPAPVFVDPSGRRRRLFRRVAMIGIALVAGYVVVLVAALLGAPVPSSVLLPIPGVQTPAPTTTEPETTTSSAPSGADQQPATAADPAHPAGAAGTATGSTAVPTAAAGQPVAAVTAPGTTAAASSTTATRNTHAPSEPPGKASTTSTGRHP